LKLAAPIPRPTKLRGFSTFEKHLIQSAEGAARRLAAGAADPEAAYTHYRKAMNLENMPAPGWYKTSAYYLMDTAAVTGHDTVVPWPAYSNWIDYELEIVAVIGRGGKDIARENAKSHIFGYTIVNDLSARDAQLEAMATGLGPAKGKDFDNSNPMGPCIVTADEIPDPYILRARVRINGEEWSCTDGREAHYRFDECVAYASKAQTLLSGEMFTTGTLPGCSSLELIRTVNKGDVIELEVEGIGILRTRIG
jgi:2-keto-4-pentenoate hydratase/2-oxohepta-3-ene-1,7-dioic acid hydratase in catechol pathway